MCCFLAEYAFRKPHCNVYGVNAFSLIIYDLFCTISSSNDQ